MLVVNAYPSVLDYEYQLLLFEIVVNVYKYVTLRSVVECVED